MKLFISYSHEDKDFVDKLAVKLVDKRVNIFVDRWELKVGDSITQRIEDAITNSSHLLVIMSPNSVNSNWCKREINAGFVKELEAKRVVILPVLISDCQIPLFLKDKLYADFRQNFNSGIKQILNSISEFDKETTGRINEKEFYFTDYLMSWGKRGGKFELHIDVIDFSIDPKEPYSILTNVVFIANENATKKFDQYVKQKIDWAMKDIILLMCAENKEATEGNVALEKGIPFNTTLISYDPKLDYLFTGYITIKLLGSSRGNVIYYFGNIFKKLSERAKG